MRIEGSMARTTAMAVLIVAALYARGTRAQSGWIDGGYWANGQYNISGWACDRDGGWPRFGGLAHWWNAWWNRAVNEAWSFATCALNGVM